MPLRARGFDVDVVVANGEVRDDLHLRRQTFENLRAEVLRVTGEDGMSAPGALDKLVTRVEPIVGIQARVVVAL